MLLLDTHALVWFVHEPWRISERLRNRMGDADVYVSEVSGIELAIKANARNIPMLISVADVVEAADFTPLPVAIGVHLRLLGLPLIHRDPFDRLLVAQALHEGMTLVTNDRYLRNYPVPTFW